MWFLIVALWIISGCLLAGFGFGPFYNSKTAVSEARLLLFGLGTVTGPLILLFIFDFYHKFLGTSGVEKVQWKFLFSK